MASLVMKNNINETTNNLEKLQISDIIKYKNVI
jgi:hypothetical protein